MSRFEILIKPSVEKDLRKLPATTVTHIFAAIEQLADTPCIPPDKKLTGSLRTWRHRVGDYRIIYELDTTAEIVIIQYVRHRREVYRRF